MDSMEGRGGRTPRARTPRRLYRGLRAVTHSLLLAAPGWDPCRAEGALTSRCILSTTVPDSWKRTRGYAPLTLSESSRWSPFTPSQESPHNRHGPGYMDSMAGRGGRTPRAHDSLGGSIVASVLGRTAPPSRARIGIHCRAEGALTSRCILSTTVPDS